MNIYFIPYLILFLSFDQRSLLSLAPATYAENQHIGEEYNEEWIGEDYENDNEVDDRKISLFHPVKFYYSFLLTFDQHRDRFIKEYDLFYTKYKGRKRDQKNTREVSITKISWLRSLYFFIKNITMKTWRNSEDYLKKYGYLWYTCLLLSICFVWVFFLSFIFFICILFFIWIILPIMLEGPMGVIDTWVSPFIFICLPVFYIILGCLFLILSPFCLIIDLFVNIRERISGDGKQDTSLKISYNFLLEEIFPKNIKSNLNELNPSSNSESPMTQDHFMRLSHHFGVFYNFIEECSYNAYYSFLKDKNNKMKQEIGSENKEIGMNQYVECVTRELTGLNELSIDNNRFRKKRKNVISSLHVLYEYYGYFKKLLDENQMRKFSKIFNMCIILSNVHQLDSTEVELLIPLNQGKNSSLWNSLNIYKLIYLLSDSLADCFCQTELGNTNLTGELLDEDFIDDDELFSVDEIWTDLYANNWIGSIQHRVEQLKYKTSLNKKEKKILNKVIYFYSWTQRFIFFVKKTFMNVLTGWKTYIINHYFMFILFILFNSGSIIGFCLITIAPFHMIGLGVFLAFTVAFLIQLIAIGIYSKETKEEKQEMRIFIVGEMILFFPIYAVFSIVGFFVMTMIDCYYLLKKQFVGRISMPYDIFQSAILPQTTYDQIHKDLNDDPNEDLSIHFFNVNEALSSISTSTFQLYKKGNKKQINIKEYIKEIKKTILNSLAQASYENSLDYYSNLCQDMVSVENYFIDKGIPYNEDNFYYMKTVIESMSDYFYIEDVLKKMGPQIQDRNTLIPLLYTEMKIIIEIVQADILTAVDNLNTLIFNNINAAA